MKQWRDWLVDPSRAGVGIVERSSRLTAAKLLACLLLLPFTSLKVTVPSLGKCTWHFAHKYQMFGHSRDARGILGKSTNSWPPSPQIKTPPKGVGGGGVWTPYSQQMFKKPLESSLFFILQAFLILVGWNYTCNTLSIGLGGKIWPVTSMRRVGPPVLVELQRSHCCNWGHQAPPKAFIHTRGGQTIKFMPFLAPSKFPRKFAQTRGRGLLAKLFL